jgi:hypothetical protein
LSEAASTIEAGVLSVEQIELRFRFRIQMYAGGECVERAWEMTANGIEGFGGGVVSCLSWDGDVLVFRCGSDRGDAPWSMTWRYELIDAGQGLRAVERMRGSMGDQDNIWIFARG